jgi:tRNA pseudouridine13 synthase
LTDELPDWRRFLPDPALRGVIRAEAEDFQVRELPLVEPEGSGNHLWLEIEKRNANTHWVAERLAEAAAVPVRDVGYAGMKDRRAVTTQWFSIGMQEAGNDDWQNWIIPDVRVLQAKRHARKLQRGALRGNRFRIRVRALSGDADGLDERLDRLAARGVPNYFGPQRFGHQGRNFARGARWLEQGGRLRRAKRSLYLSAVRSALFNDVLSERVRQSNWDRLIDGDIAQLNGSRALFACALPDADLERRCAEFDIHPTGPLPGSGGLQPARDAAVLETDVLRQHDDLLAALGRARAESGRRSLRVALTSFEWDHGDSELELRFDLPAGSYATAVLRELVSLSDGSISEDV